MDARMDECMDKQFIDKWVHGIPKGESFIYMKLKHRNF